ncbi:hypothetical protein HYH03_005127 [Edaphochlamys debaryana]|uniref:Uncharacterized protein n=1 Tax=Edaphochlamys debaryana TaxID=47281 RepID=A0A835YFM0_9CHLO|nr:hypothetical protein HYH03_005127 [Edaphochlamys debaryana]|eukprot:KAG2496714.1 hypothetical protein HYH03_005127 [Edaphochlamys debaryana]
MPAWARMALERVAARQAEEARGGARRAGEQQGVKGKGRGRGGEKEGDSGDQAAAEAEQEAEAEAVLKACTDGHTFSHHVSGQGGAALSIGALRSLLLYEADQLEGMFDFLESSPPTSPSSAGPTAGAGVDAAAPSGPGRAGGGERQRSSARRRPGHGFVLLSRLLWSLGIAPTAPPGDGLDWSHSAFGHRPVVGRRAPGVQRSSPVPLTALAAMVAADACGPPSCTADFMRLVSSPPGPVPPSLAGTSTSSKPSGAGLGSVSSASDGDADGDDEDADSGSRAAARDPGAGSGGPRDPLRSAWAKAARLQGAWAAEAEQRLRDERRRQASVVPQEAARRFWSLRTCLSAYPHTQECPVPGACYPATACLLPGSGVFDWSQEPDVVYGYQNYYPHPGTAEKTKVEVLRPGPPDLPMCLGTDEPGTWWAGQWHRRNISHDGGEACAYYRVPRKKITKCLTGKKVWFLGDSFVRQLFLRLIWYLRGIEGIMEHYFHEPATYTYYWNGTDALALGNGTLAAFRAPLAPEERFRLGFQYRLQTRNYAGRILSGGADVIVMGAIEHAQEGDDFGADTRVTVETMLRRAAADLARNGARAAPGAGPEDAGAAAGTTSAVAGVNGTLAAVPAAAAAANASAGGNRRAAASAAGVADGVKEGEGEEEKAPAGPSALGPPGRETPAQGRLSQFFWLTFADGDPGPPHHLTDLAMGFAARARELVARLRPQLPNINIQLLPFDRMSVASPYLRNELEREWVWHTLGPTLNGLHYQCAVFPEYGTGARGFKAPPDLDCTDGFNLNLALMLMNSVCAWNRRAPGPRGRLDA